MCAMVSNREGFLLMMMPTSDLEGVFSSSYSLEEASKSHSTQYAWPFFLKLKLFIFFVIVGLALLFLGRLVLVGELG
jgi:hypothetical protein